MKKVIKSGISLILVLLLTFSLISCNKAVDEKEATPSVWDSATYLEDKEFGEGSKSVEVKVKAEDKTVTFTVNTEKETVGAALLEHKLISGEQGDFGMYIKKVNGILADYDVDKSYWAFYINGEYATSGVDTTPIVEGESYSLEYTK